MWTRQPDEPVREKRFHDHLIPADRDFGEHRNYLVSNSVQHGHATFANARHAPEPSSVPE